MSEIKNSALFIELDALLDTRIGALLKLGFDTVEKVLQENYIERLSDNFKNIDLKLFRQYYKERDKTILKNSVVTPMSIIINDFVKKTSKQNLTSPTVFKPKVILNIYPYELKKEEIQNLLYVLVNITDKLADIEIVNMAYEEISPSYLSLETSILILYEYHIWLETQTKIGNFKTKACPEISLLGPAIYFTEEKIITDKNPFIAIEELTAPFIKLKLLPIKYFSFVNSATD